MKCKNCHEDAKGSGNVYCSDKCKKEASIIKKSKLIAKKAESLAGNENVDYIICQWCKTRVKRVYGIHIKNHHVGKTINDYKQEFPNSLVTCSVDKEKTSKNSGLHMKEEFYRQLAKDNVLGEKNPNHKSKTTEEIRKSRSPFSQAFVSYKDIDNKEAAVKEFVKTALNERLTETQLQYWLKKFDGDEVKAKESYKNRQTTFSLETCVSKYGEEIGFDIWRERNIRWSKKIEAKYKNGEFTKFRNHNYSNAELKFIEKILNEFKPTKPFYSALSGNRQFFRYFKEDGITHSYDFVYDKKIIEFNGDYWHCNPNKYKPEYFHTVQKCTAQEKWNADKKKLDLIKKAGYNVLVIWESEFNIDPITAIKKCVEFLNE